MSAKKSKIGATKIAALMILALVVLAFSVWTVWKLPVGAITYESDPTVDDIVITKPHEQESKAIHLDIPKPLKAIYITACTASEKRLRNKSLDLFNGTELNAIIIDIKDYTGTLAYSDTKFADDLRGNGCIITDLPEFLTELHNKGIYTIARVTVFQDPLYAPLHPDQAVKSKSKPDGVWRDKKGLAYIDPNAKKYWDHVVDISKEAYSIGFDEINYDYIRFPSDGDLTDTVYDMSSTTSKADVIEEFFIYLREKMSDTPVVMSADLFGLTTSADGDLGIGQVLERALPYFDYVAPMVYPSHFAYGFIGIPRPAEKPYEVVKYSMDKAVQKAIAVSSSPEKLRPWLQDFNLGATYTPDMVRQQIQASYDAGLTSWMLWNAGSVYSKDALLPAGVSDTVKVIEMPRIVESSTTTSASSTVIGQ